MLKKTILLLILMSLLAVIFVSAVCPPFMRTRELARKEIGLMASDLVMAGNVESSPMIKDNLPLFFSFVKGFLDNNWEARCSNVSFTDAEKLNNFRVLTRQKAKQNFYYNTTINDNFTI